MLTNDAQQASKGKFPESVSLIHKAVKEELWSQDLVTDGYADIHTDGQGGL